MAQHGGQQLRLVYHNTGTRRSLVPTYKHTHTVFITRSPQRYDMSTSRIAHLLRYTTYLSLGSVRLYVCRLLMPYTLHGTTTSYCTSADSGDSCQNTYSAAATSILFLEIAGVYPTAPASFQREERRSPAPSRSW